MSAIWLAWPRSISIGELPHTRPGYVLSEVAVYSVAVSYSTNKYKQPFTVTFGYTIMYLMTRQ